MEDADATGEFLEKLADFFRYNVRKTDSDSTLREEIALVDTYIYILNVRFAGDIHYSKEVEEGIGQIRVPGMILQPLVENAVSHGIREMMGEGIITLHAVRDEEYIRVSIRDNGAGMTGEQISRIFEKAETGMKPEEAVTEEAGRENDERGDAPHETPDQTETSTGIGLVNVIRRLSLFYNREGLLSIHSEGRMMGTEVTVLLPTEGQ
jgi:sensor histidine kinase YesM